jgi:hypothetical protein
MRSCGLPILSKKKRRCGLVAVTAFHPLTAAQVAEHIERLVMLLKGDEQAEVTEVDGAETMTDPAIAAGNDFASALLTGGVGVAATGSDDEDDRIEEV